MARPPIATSADVRAAVLALLRDADASESPSGQTFRRVVSVRKVRAYLGGGNPSTIGREINAVEAELVRDGASLPALAELPADIAALMTQLWQAAVGVQLDEVLALKSQAQGVADAAHNALTEAQLRGEVLMQELVELRAGIAERDKRLAQILATQATLETQIAALTAELEVSRARGEHLGAELVAKEASASAAIASARDRYDGLAKQLMLETEQQRQAAQVENSRLVGQLKFAEKREATQLARIAHMENELQEVRAQKDQAMGEISALKYVNTALRTQVDGFLSALPKSQAKGAPPVANLATARKRVARTGPSAASTKRTKPEPLS
jgi:chromosome segregation ATPase